ncbi:DUF2283 domain-containing protein [Nitratireductor luteus]|uniref:DUF2283 domain-containing protein n=1 Tax=Nitratireductor luteus TaxID=2976980 RepID=UPI00223EC853|nr:DUF2283 domain-containing protein [Nitratireductor luteus]
MSSNIDRNRAPDTVSFNVSYDRRTDVLYISTRPQDGTDARIDRSGIVWRYDDAGQLVGVTVMHFFDRWGADTETLAGKLSKRFHLPPQQANKVVDHALFLHQRH